MPWMWLSVSSVVLHFATERVKPRLQTHPGAGALQAGLPSLPAASSAPKGMDLGQGSPRRTRGCPQGSSEGRAPPPPTSSSFCPR